MACAVEVAVTGFVPDAAAFIASSSALVGKRRGPAFLSFPLLSFAPASRASFIASSSALVGKSLGPAFFFSFFPASFFALFFTADFFGAFLGARDTGTNSPLLLF